jgi:hypothetical protein
VENVQLRGLRVLQTSQQVAKVLANKIRKQPQYRGVASSNGSCQVPTSRSKSPHTVNYAHTQAAHIENITISAKPCTA